MKIIDVAEFYTDQGGGVKTYINQKLRAAARLGHEMIVVAPGRKSMVENRHGGKVIWIKGPRLPLDPRYIILWRKKEVHRILDREQPDIVEGSSVWTGGNFVGSWNGDAVKSLIFHQDPVAVYPQTCFGNLMPFDSIDRMFGFFWNYLERLSSQYETTVVSGEWLKHRLLGFGIHNPVAVPFGVDKSFFSPRRRDSSLRSALLADLGLPENAHLMICVSRFHPEKRLSTVIDGFKEASKEKKMGLLVYGDGPIEKWIEWKSNGADNIKLMGFTTNRDELANIMASCDYFVHGSAAETFGLVVAEAMCSGLPIVVPDTGGAVDLAIPDFAEVYSAGDPESLASALLKVTGRNRDKLTFHCMDAVAHSIKTIDEHFSQLFSLYQKLINQKKNLFTYRKQVNSEKLTRS